MIYWSMGLKSVAVTEGKKDWMEFGRKMKKRNNKGTKNGCEERGLERERGGKGEREREGGET